MRSLLILFLTFITTNALYYNTTSSSHSPEIEDQGIGPNITKRLKKLKYPLQAHAITTEDGYILTWFRIQARNQKEFKTGLPVVLCMHGVGDSGDTFVINDEENSIGLKLANSGYDVWIGNVRGTKHGLNHVKLKTRQRKFWEFSWEEMAEFDLPAGFEYIHKETGQNITYIGHSQGSTIMLAALSDENPIVTKHLKNFIALSPVAFVSHVESGVIKWMSNSSLAKMFLTLHMYSFLQPDFFSSEMGHIFCQFYPDVCGNQLSKIYGYNPVYDNYDQINVILQYEPGGTSVFNMIHWQQLVKSGKFCKYDYGMKENIKKYGAPMPPDYDLSKIKIPVNMFFGTYDSIIGDEDSKLLIDALSGTEKASYYKYYPADHVTFTWGKNINMFWNDMMAKIEGK
jgi:gastric triacylglycerol lipase